MALLDMTGDTEAMARAARSSADRPPDIFASD
jgi:hypothetical protein